MKDIHGIYFSLPMTEEKDDRYCLWLAKQWLAGRLQSYEIKTERGLSLFASAYPFPSKAPNAQQVA